MLIYFINARTVYWPLIKNTALLASLPRHEKLSGSEEDFFISILPFNFSNQVIHENPIFRRSNESN